MEPCHCHTEPYISLPDAATRLGVTHAAMRQAARRQTLRTVKIGRDRFTTESWLELYHERYARNSQIG